MFKWLIRQLHIMYYTDNYRRVRWNNKDGKRKDRDQEDRKQHEPASNLLQAQKRTSEEGIWVIYSVWSWNCTHCFLQQGESLWVLQQQQQVPRAPHLTPTAFFFYVRHSDSIWYFYNLENLSSLLSSRTNSANSQFDI